MPDCHLKNFSLKKSEISNFLRRQMTDYPLKKSEISKFLRSESDDTGSLNGIRVVWILKMYTTQI